MSDQIIKQPNGRYAIFSSVCDDFVVVDANKEEIIQEFETALGKFGGNTADRIIHQLDSGDRPYHQFTLSFDDAVGKSIEIHGNMAQIIISPFGV